MNKNNQMPPKGQNGQRPKQQNRAPKSKKPAGFIANLSTTFIVILMILFLYTFVADQQKNVDEIALSQLASDVKSELVEKIELSGNEIVATYKKANDADVEVMNTTKSLQLKTIRAMTT